MSKKMESQNLFVLDMGYTSHRGTKIEKTKKNARSAGNYRAHPRKLKYYSRFDSTSEGFMVE